VQDSAKVRGEMTSELGIFVSSIMGIFNLICPRPYCSDRDGSRASQESLESSNKVRKSLLTHSVNKSISFAEGILGRSLTYKSDPTSDEKVDKMRERLVPQEANTAKQHIAAQRHRVLRVHDYGKPKFGLSEASWALIVLARIAVEDVVRLLDLPHVSFEAPTINEKARMQLHRQNSKSLQLRTSTSKSSHTFLPTLSMAARLHLSSNQSLSSSARNTPRGSTASLPCLNLNYNVINNSSIHNNDIGSNNKAHTHGNLCAPASGHSSRTGLTLNLNYSREERFDCGLHSLPPSAASSSRSLLDDAGTLLHAPRPANSPRSNRTPRIV
jgi:hypothetical protein